MKQPCITINVYSCYKDTNIDDSNYRMNRINEQIVVKIKLSLWSDYCETQIN